MMEGTFKDYTVTNLDIKGLNCENMAFNKTQLIQVSPKKDRSR